MIPKKIEISGFRSFQEAVTLKFPKGNLFVQLAGKNEVAPEVGANGVGKSSLLDAICWVFFGKTVRGVKGPSIRNWFNNAPTYVTIWFKHRGKNYKLSRHFAPNKILLHSKTGGIKKIDQLQVHQLLGWNYEAFCQTVVLGQFSQFFFDLSPSEKLRVFSESMNLMIWERARDVAGEKLKEAQALEDQYTERLHVTRGQLKEVEKYDPKDAERRIADIEKKIEGMQATIDGYDEKLAALKNEKVNVYHRQRRIKLRREDAEQRLVSLDKLVRKVERQELKVKAEVRAKQSRVTELRRHRTKVRAMNKTDCPTCLTPIGAAQISRARKVIGHQIGRLKVSLRKSRKLAEQLTNQRISDRKKLSNVNDKLDRIDREKIANENETRDIKRQMQNTSALRDALIDNMNALKWDTVEISKEKDKQVARIDELAKKIEGLKLFVSNIQVRIRRCEAWQERFKNIRLWVVDTALDELKSLTNAYLQELGLKGWRVEFRVDREGAKKGSLIRGFSVLIYSPDSGNKSVPWEAYSGGEIQRLRVAGACAISSLIRNRLNVDCPIEMWDEPTAMLSGEGIDSLIRFLAERTQKEQRQVWLIDHRSLDQGAFDKRYIADLTKTGTRIEAL